MRREATWSAAFASVSCALGWLARSRHFLIFCMMVLSTSAVEDVTLAVPSSVSDLTKALYKGNGASSTRRRRALRLGGGGAGCSLSCSLSALLLLSFWISLSIAASPALS